MNKLFSWAAFAAGCALAAAGQARADATVDLTGTDANAGLIDLGAAGAGAFGGLITSGGVTGYSLWGLLGGATGASTAAVAGGTQTTNGGIVNFTPTGDNAKNAILRDYLIITDGAGFKSIVSLGEIDPNFVGAAASNNFLLSFSGSTVTFNDVATGAAGRDLTNVTGISLLAVPASPGPPAGAAPQSPYVTLSGAVTNPGNYGTAGGTIPFTTHATQVQEAVNGDTYTGVGLFDFLDPLYSSVDGYVITAGTDGYEVVLSLAELDPSLGGNPGNLLPYADTNGNFPSAGVARTILPGDTAFAHGRWESDLITLDVVTVPEPGSLALLASGLGLLALRRKRRV